MENTTKGVSNDITEHPHDDKECSGMFGFSNAVLFAVTCLTCYFISFQILLFRCSVDILICKWWRFVLVLTSEAVDEVILYRASGPVYKNS